MTRPFKIALSTILCAGLFIYGGAQRPIPHWFKTPHGSGIVRITDIPEQPPVVLFTSPDLSTSYDTIKFYRVEEPTRPADTVKKLLPGDESTLKYIHNRTGEWEYTSITDIRPLDWFEGQSDDVAGENGQTGWPRLHPEMNLRAVRDKGQWCEVVVNETTGATAYIIKGHRSPVYMSWGDYLLQIQLSPYMSSETPVYKTPSDKSASKIMDVRLTNIKEVRGAWVLRVQHHGHREAEVLGWIRWHDGERVLIHVREFILM